MNKEDRGMRSREFRKGGTELTYLPHTNKEAKEEGRTFALCLCCHIHATGLIIHRVCDQCLISSNDREFDCENCFTSITISEICSSCVEILECQCKECYDTRHNSYTCNKPSEYEYLDDSDNTLLLINTNANQYEC